MKKICIVRDEQGFWSEIAVYLEGVNAELLPMGSPPKWQQILDCRPDLIIMGADSYAVTMHRLRRLPIMVVTEASRDSILEGRKEKRNLCIVRRPLSRERFLESTSRMLLVPPRNAFKTLIRIFTGDSDHGSIGQSLDFSTGGISFQTESRFTAGDRCTLSFYIPEVSQSVKLKAKVVRCLESGQDGMPVYGAQFVDLRAKELEIMQAFVVGQ